MLASNMIWPCLIIAVTETRHCILPERYVNVSMTPRLSAYDRAITETGGDKWNVSQVNQSNVSYLAWQTVLLALATDYLLVWLFSTSTLPKTNDRLVIK